MKTLILFALLIINYTAGAQKLKDLLYSGKMKTDSGTVVKKDDDLSTKIDTATRKPVLREITNSAAMPGDPSLKELNNQNDSTVIASIEKKDNNKVWKEFMDTMTSELKTDISANKKIKKGTYFIMVDYTIDTDGKVTINNVYPSPENSMLQILVKDKLTLYAPMLEPVLSSNGKPRKLNKRQNINLTKD